MDSNNELERRIACPMQWCSGRWSDHGGDGRSPEDWFHEAHTVIALPFGAAMYRTQLGSSEPEWSLIVEADGGAKVVMAPADPQQYADRLLELATAIREIHAGDATNLRGSPGSVTG